MKLRTLLDAAFDETWFCIVVGGGKEYYLWNADYLGWHPSVMPDVEPLLDLEFDEFELVVRENPEIEGEQVPMVYVFLLPQDPLASSQFTGCQQTESEVNDDGSRTVQ